MDKTCTDCVWFKRLENLKPHDLSEFGCLQSRWAGYVIDPQQSPCGGQAHQMRQVSEEARR